MSDLMQITRNAPSAGANSIGIIVGRPYPFIAFLLAVCLTFAVSFLGNLEDNPAICSWCAGNPWDANIIPRGPMPRERIIVSQAQSLLRTYLVGILILALYLYMRITVHLVAKHYSGRHRKAVIALIIGVITAPSIIGAHNINITAYINILIGAISGLFSGDVIALFCVLFLVINLPAVIVIALLAGLAGKYHDRARLVVGALALCVTGFLLHSQADRHAPHEDSDYYRLNDFNRATLMLIQKRQTNEDTVALGMRINRGSDAAGDYITAYDTVALTRLLNWATNPTIDYESRLYIFRELSKSALSPTQDYKRLSVLHQVITGSTGPAVFPQEALKMFSALYLLANRRYLMDEDCLTKYADIFNRRSGILASNSMRNNRHAIEDWDNQVAIAYTILSDTNHVEYHQLPYPAIERYRQLLYHMIVSSPQAKGLVLSPVALESGLTWIEGPRISPADRLKMVCLMTVGELNPDHETRRLGLLHRLILDSTIPIAFRRQCPRVFAAIYLTPRYDCLLTAKNLNIYREIIMHSSRVLPSASHEPLNVDDDDTTRLALWNGQVASANAILSDSYYLEEHQLSLAAVKAYQRILASSAFDVSKPAPVRP